MLPQGRREYSLQRSLMKVTGSDLMKLLRMITTLSIIHNPTFWVAHDAYLSSRFKLLQVLEKYTLLGAIVRQYERSKPGITVNVKAYRDRKAKLRFAATYTDKEPLTTSTSTTSTHLTSPDSNSTLASAGASSPQRGPDGRFVGEFCIWNLFPTMCQAHVYSCRHLDALLDDVWPRDQREGRVRPS